MAMAKEQLIENVVGRVLSLLGEEGASSCGYEKVDEAVAAAGAAQKAWQWDFSLEARMRVVDRLRRDLLEGDVIREVSALALEETGMGRLDDKLIKKRLAVEKTPGPEFFATKAVSGDHGLVLEELSPFGVIASITPSTNPVASVFNNTLCMISGGNGVVFAPHPGAVKSTLRALEHVTRSLEASGAPSGLVTTLTQPSMENLGLLMEHRGIQLISATGGPGVVKAALSSGKPAVGAGPGNPPVVVDETADLRAAARDVILGCSFDNNLPCIAEKELFAVNCIADELKKHMLESGAFELKDPKDVGKLMELTLRGDAPNKACVGKSAPWLLEQIGLKVGGDVRVILVETPEDHPFVQVEMLMPVLPLVRVADFDEALAASLRAEHGFRHSAAIHSTHVVHMSRMARAMETTIFTKNAPSYASIGVGGDCPTAFTIATTTGQGPTTPLSFCRTRRCLLHGAFRIV